MQENLVGLFLPTHLSSLDRALSPMFVTGAVVRLAQSRTNRIFTMFFSQYLLSSVFYHRWQWWGNALILTVIWKNFVRTLFRILLSRLELMDFSTGLLFQPIYAAASFMCSANPRGPGDKAKPLTILKTTYECGSIFFLAFTVFLLTLCPLNDGVTCRHVWLHMSLDDPSSHRVADIPLS